MTRATQSSITSTAGPSGRNCRPAGCSAGWDLGTSKFHDWKDRYGKVNEHNGQVPRDWWLEDWEKQAILDFHDRHPLEGYRRLTFMMLDDDVVAVSPSSAYRVLKNAGRLDRSWAAPSKKGTGFVQPLRPHEHWHVDISYINVGGTFYFLFTRPGRLQPLHRALGDPRNHEGARRGDHRATGLEKYPGDSRGSSATTARSSSPGTSRSSSA